MIERTDQKWKLEGFDTFDNTSYRIRGEYDTEAEVLLAAHQQFKEIEEMQPTSESGGQGEGGIQDQIWVVRPDGSQYRYAG